MHPASHGWRTMRLLQVLHSLLLHRPPHCFQHVPTSFLFNVPVLFHMEQLLPSHSSQGPCVWPKTQRCFFDELGLSGKMCLVRDLNRCHFSHGVALFSSFVSGHVSQIDKSFDCFSMPASLITLCVELGILKWGMQNHWRTECWIPSSNKSGCKWRIILSRLVLPRIFMTAMKSVTSRLVQQ